MLVNGDPKEIEAALRSTMVLYIENSKVTSPVLNRVKRYRSEFQMTIPRHSSLFFRYIYDMNTFV